MDCSTLFSYWNFTIEVLNTNDPNDNDLTGIDTEVGIALLNSVDAAYNHWIGTALELADGDGASDVDICDGKAVIGLQDFSDTYYTEVIEMAFLKWDEIVADEPQMFSIMANDPDADHGVQALQWGHGIFSPKNWEFYASIIYSSSEPSVDAVEDFNQPGFPSEYIGLRSHPTIIVSDVSSVKIRPTDFLPDFSLDLIAEPL